MKKVSSKEYDLDKVQTQKQKISKVGFEKPKRINSRNYRDLIEDDDDEE